MNTPTASAATQPEAAEPITDSRGRILRTHPGRFAEIYCGAKRWVARIKHPSESATVAEVEAYAARVCALMNAGLATDAGEVRS